MSEATRRYNGLDPARPFYYGASPSLLAQAPTNDTKPAPVPPAYLGWPNLFRHLEASLASEKTWRLSWWRHWADIARFELPRRYTAFVVQNDYNRGIRRDGAILDNTATLDGETCAGGIMTVCTDPDRQWLKLGVPPGIEVDRAGQMFFDDLTERLRFVQDETNFYESLNQYYEDKVFFGTGVAIDYEDRDNIFVCRNPCAGEYCLTVGPDNENNSLIEELRWTVRQIVEFAGYDNCPLPIREAWDEKGGALDGEHVIGHAIEPNFAISDDRGGEVSRLPGHFTWREVYWTVGRENGAPLSIAGFHEKPFAASQWHRKSNDPYGHGPGYTVLGDTIELQILVARQAELVEKLARPPTVAPVALKNEPHSIKPDQITYYDATTGAPQFKPIYEVNPQGLPAITASIVATQDRVHRGMHSDLFRMIQQLSERPGEKTATEIDALREERLMQLGPVIGRVYRYGIRPRIKRQLAIMRRRGLWPRIPDSLRPLLASGDVQIEFISMLTLAQRAGSVSSIERTFAFAQSIQPEFPESGDVLDADEAVREAAAMRGASAKIVRAPADVKKLRAARQQQMQQAQAGQTAMAAIGGAKALGETSMSNDNALGALVRGPR